MLLKRAVVFILATVPLLLNCQSNPTKAKLQVYQLGQPWELKVGQTALIRGENLKITFQAVEDWRCCSVCLCIWFSNAKISLQISKLAGMPETIELNSDLDPKEVGWNGYKIKLNWLAPYPQDPLPLPSEAYVANLVVTLE